MNACLHIHYCPDCRKDRTCDFPECTTIQDSPRICVGCVGRTYRKPIDQMVQFENEHFY